MNRRTFIGAAAVSTAAVLQTNASPRVPCTTTKKIVEVDIIDPAATEYFRDESVDVLARLEEPDPGDPGQLSGCSLRILDGRLHAELDAVQRDGSRISHWLGRVDGREMSLIIYADLADEDDSFGTVIWPAGVFLNLVAGAEPELSVCIRQHCLGVLRGHALTAFMGCLRTRCEMARA